MTHQDPDESHLQALFEKTAAPPDGPTLTRMAARANEVPGRARRPWLPLILAAPAAAAALAVALMIVPGTAPVSAPAARGSEAALTAWRGPGADHSPAPADPPALEGPDVLAWGYLDDDALLVPLDEPALDTELDAWLSAADELLDEGS